MKKFSIQIVFICFLFFMYYFYSAWVNSLKIEDLMFQLFDPFKLILLGMIFTIIYNTIKNLLFSRFVNLKQYRQNLRNNILFEFENTINYLNKLKKIIKENNLVEAKVLLKTFKGISYKPAYLVDFIDTFANQLLLQKDIDVFLNSIEVIISNVETNFKTERERVLENKKGILEVRMSEAYYRNTSWDAIRYNLALNNLDKIKSSKWKISSLYISKFTNSLFISFMVSIFIFVIVGVYFYLTKKTISKYFYIAFVSSMLLISMIHYNTSILFASKKMNINIYWSHLCIYYFIIFIIYTNILVNLIFFPNISTTSSDKTTSWYNSELLNFLKSILYIVFSTMLLSYVFGGLLQLLENTSFNWKNSIEAFFIPLVIYVVTLVINIMSIQRANSNLYIVNFTILILFWVWVSVWNKFFYK